MNSKVDKIEEKMENSYKEKVATDFKLSPNFTNSVMKDVREAAKAFAKQERVAWKAGWISFATAALVMIYFGITFEQTSINDELFSTVYNYDSISILEGI